MKPAPYCSPAMLKMLYNYAAGRPPTDGLSGRSAHGGAEGTRRALASRNWIDETGLTREGRAYLANRPAP